MSGVNVKIDLSGIEKKVSPENFAKGKLAIANQMLMDMERFVPKRRGDLRSSGHVRQDSIVYATPYARLLYYGKKFWNHSKQHSSKTAELYYVR